MLPWKRLKTNGWKEYLGLRELKWEEDEQIHDGAPHIYYVKNAQVKWVTISFRIQKSQNEV